MHFCLNEFLHVCHANIFSSTEWKLIPCHYSIFLKKAYQVLLLIEYEY